MKVSVLDVKVVNLEVRGFNYLKKVLKKFEETELTQEEKTKFLQIFLDDLCEETRIIIEKELSIPNQFIDEVVMKNFGSIYESVIENPEITLEKFLIRYFERILQKFQKFEISEKEITKFLNIFLYQKNLHSIEIRLVADILKDEETPSRIVDELAKYKVYGVENPNRSKKTSNSLTTVEINKKVANLEVHIFNYLKKVLKKFEETELTQEEKIKFLQIFLDDLCEETQNIIEKELSIPNQFIDEIVTKNFGNISDSVIENPEITLENHIIRYFERILQKFEKFEISEIEITKFLNIFLYPRNLRSIEIRLVADISRDEKTPSRVLEELAKYEISHNVVPMYALKNPSISEKALNELAKEGKSDFVYYNIACNPKATAEIIDNLLKITKYKKKKEESLELYRAIARHKNTSKQALKKLIKIDEEEFFDLVANHLNASAKLIDKLSIKHPLNWKVIEGILKNPKIKVETLDRIIINYESKMVQEIARRIRELKLNE